MSDTPGKQVQSENIFDKARVNYRPDRRRAQINSIVALVFDAIGKHVPDASRRQATYDLVDALHKTGASFFTEQDRQEAGLSPRDDHGWTREELAVMDARLLKALLEPMPAMVIEARPR
ncbi:MAG: hypothetical protein ACOYOJ_21200 [Alsobacter sp.]